MSLIWVITLIVAVVGFRVWAAIDRGLLAAYFKRLGKRTTVRLLLSVIAGGLAIYLSRR